MQRLWVMSVIVVGGFVAACGGPEAASESPLEFSAQAELSGSYVGCYTDSATRALPTRLAASGATVESCVAAAQAEGLAYAGVQYGGECWAGNTLGYTLVSDSECNKKCTADASETCGGAWRASVYSVTTEAPPPPTGYVGCYTDSATRALPTQLASSGATVESCVAAAQAKGLAYAGVQYGGQCWAGNTPGYTLVSDAECNMKCTADAAEICGGSWRASIYSTGVSAPPPSVTVSVDPASTSVPAAAKKQFTCTVTGSSNTSCSWTVQEGSAGGGVSSTGEYTAPSSAGTYHVVATSQADSAKNASATVTVTLVGAGGQDIVVNWNDLRQTMDGFGASDAYISSTLDGATIQLLFDTTKGIGLSIYRTGINPSGGPGLRGVGWASVKAAVTAYPSLKLWAAPWTPPASYKSNNSITNGGYLLPGNYDAWATTLAGYVTQAKAEGITIWGISPQNEPDYVASYESCTFSSGQMRDFIKVLGPKLKALNPPVKLLAGDNSGWGGFMSSYVPAIEADAAALANTDYYITHQYAGVAAPSSSKRVIWQTEMSNFSSNDPGIGNAVGVAGWIHSAITTGNVSAWHYWWLMGHDSTNQGLFGVNNSPSPLTKRLYAMGNFSRWVRPGWVRVGTTGSKSGISGVTAYKNPSTGDFALVVINSSGGSVTATFGLSGATAPSVAPWVTTNTAVGNIGTDGNLSLGSASKGVPTSIAVSSGAFTATVPYGVTTFVGNAH